MDNEYRLPIRIFHDFTERIEQLGIGYMLTGSMAMFHYSVYRMTADIDVVVELEPRHAQKFIDSLEPFYVIPHNSMRRAIDDRRIFNVLHMETAFKVDCVIPKTSPFQIKAFERKQLVDFYGKDCFVITAEDLVLSKLVWSRESKSDKQKTDVKNLMRNPLDSIYIEEWAEILDVRETYETYRAEICE